MAEQDFVTSYRGQTPDDIREICHNLCKDYLGGIWRDIDIENIEVKRIIGGFTNQLYYCGLRSGFQTTKQEPKEVAIRLYGDKFFSTISGEHNSRLSDAITGLVMSEKKLGPKIYGIFQNGMIMKYYKHRQFRKRECDNPVMVAKLARNLAKVHAMDAPIKRTKDWLFACIDQFYEKGYAMFPIDQFIDECNLDTLKKYDLKSEIEWSKRCVESIGSPIVFSHNDFRGSNVMVIERETMDGKTDVDDELVLCDFEHSCYGYRGVDLGSNFSEWGFVDLNDLNKDRLDFPDDSVLDAFLKAYINEWTSIYGSEYAGDEHNSLKQLRLETKVFSMVGQLFVAAFMLTTNEPIFSAKFDKRSDMILCEKFYSGYIALKNKFIEDKIINEFY